MAMRFSRPDPASPAAVADAAFGTARRGFDQNEVREFLRMVAAELGRLQERERFLERELRTATAEPNLADMELDDAALTRLLGEETARVLGTAKESAAEIRSKAEEAAAKLLAEASEEAARIREEAELEASRRRADAAADAESELEMAKQQGREMVNEARAYRERVLSELARRRELAREQIEQLVNGRDRLLQVFERARSVAVDVVSELEPLGEPNEYVNLAPTTGPVPVMVVNRPQLAGVPGEPSTAGADAAPEPEGARAAAEMDERTDEPEEASQPEAASVAAEASHADAVDEEASQPGPVAAELATEETAAVESALDETAVDESATDELATDETAVDESATDELATDETAVDEDLDDGTTEGVDAPEIVEEEPADGGEGDVAPGPSAGPESETHDDGDEASASERDVVVDLFARLRASTADGVDDMSGSEDASVVDEAAPAAGDDDTGDSDAASSDDAHDAGEGAGAPASGTTASTMVGELEPDSATTAARTDEDEAEDEESPFRRRDADLTPIIVKCARALKRALADEQNEVLESLRRGDPVTRIAELLPATDAHLDRYIEAARADLVTAANAGAVAITDGSVKRLRKGPAADAVSAAGDVIEEWLVVPLRDRLARCVADGDGDNAAITRRIRSVYREWKTQHIDEYLDDIVRMAYGRGAYEAVEQGTALVWSLDAAHPACPDCEDNGLAGAVPAGEEYPTGHLYAPAHSGCRCLLLPPDQ